jgi:hypothetical protein
MSDKELNTPMNREQLNTPRELTAEELDMVFGGPLYMKYGALEEAIKDTVQAAEEAIKDTVQASR